MGTLQMENVTYIESAYLTELAVKATYYEEILDRLVQLTVDTSYFGCILIAQTQEMQWVVSVSGECEYYTNPADAVLAYVRKVMELENG